MAKSKKFDLENPAPVVDDEDEETLAAIDEGMRDAKTGRTVPAEEVRRLLAELYAYQDALVRKGLEEMRKGRVVSHAEVVKRLKRPGRARRSSNRLSS
jgi:predicted transcriptional regulator